MMKSVFFNFVFFSSEKMLCYYIIDVQLVDWGQKREIRKRRSDTDGYGRHKIRNSMVMEIIRKERSYIINVNKNFPDITI